MTDADRIAEIEARTGKATPGPWHYDGMHWEITCPQAGAGESYWLIVSEARQTPDQDYPEDQFGHAFDANFDFIAHAREDVPLLLSALKAANERIMKLTKFLSRSMLTTEKAIATARQIDDDWAKMIRNGIEVLREVGQ